jgi:3-hydroxyisobutyrate dehydrogenase-like beta-hydroxyacid dehydrogenase
MKIAFIGLGNMGGGMAANLAGAGHQVHAFDLSADAPARAKDKGCAFFTTVSEAVAGVDAVITEPSSRPSQRSRRRISCPSWHAFLVRRAGASFLSCGL